MKLLRGDKVQDVTSRYALGPMLPGIEKHDDLCDALVWSFTTTAVVLNSAGHYGMMMSMKIKRPKTVRPTTTTVHTKSGGVRVGVPKKSYTTTVTTDPFKKK